ncbi:hypothetical protein BGZ76_008608 [Entomortierella beljakovae]|nr:hypothetical protein BGZ76_008608 [Entomortierella beljakovae]
MTPAPSSRGNGNRPIPMNNIPLPAGPPPQQQQHSGNPNNFGHSHSYSTASQSSQSSYSSQSGQQGYSGGHGTFDPPRPFISSPRASPVGNGRSGRNRNRDRDSSRDHIWRSTFDAALVKAQQAVQLDELKETALAANLYSQAANDLGRVIPMCTNEKKKQSMLAIQSIYLDRVVQLKEAMSGSNDNAHHNNSGASDSHDSGYSHHYSSSSSRGRPYEDEYQDYSHQQYQQSPMLRPHQPIYQNPRASQQYQLQPVDQHHYHHSPPPPPPQQLYQPQHVQQPEPQQQEQKEKEKGFRLFGKKRSKTQPSAPQPPELQDFHVQDHHHNNPHPMSHANQNNYPTHVASPLISHSMPQGMHPAQNTVVTPNQQQALEQPTKSKWLFGKKKSKSVSAGDGSGYNPYRDSTQMVPPFSPSINPVAHHLVSPQDHADNYSRRKQSDWFVQDASVSDQEEEYRYEDRYYDDDDEDIDPYYIADTKGRTKSQLNQPSKEQLHAKSPNVSKSDVSAPQLEHSHSLRLAGSQTQLSPLVDDQDFESGPLGHGDATNNNNTDIVDKDSGDNKNVDNDDDNSDDDGSVYHNIPGSSFIKQQQEYQEQQEQEQLVRQENIQSESRQGDYSSEHFQHHPQEVEEVYLENEEVYEDTQVFYEGGAGQSVPITCVIAEHTLEDNQELTVEPEPETETALEKTKSRRTWYGKKKKDKKDKKPKEEWYEHEHIDDVARLMEEALFGSGPPPKPSAPALHEKQSSTSLGRTISYEKASSASLARTASHEVPQVPQIPQIPQIPNLEIGESESIASTVPSSVVQDGADDVDASGIQKRSKSRSFSFFGNKKKDKSQDDFAALVLAATNEDSKSTKSGHSNKRLSSQSGNDRYAKEMAIALAVAPKFKAKTKELETEKEDGQVGEELVQVNDNEKKEDAKGKEKVKEMTKEKSKEKESKKRDSDEYVPYEYQEELEGPLMERVEVRENREIIGFVMPIEEIKDFTMEEHHESALENWDSWVNQLESFEKVLSDKGLNQSKKEKKEKEKKEKKEKKLKESVDNGVSTLKSSKSNRSSMFSIGRSDHSRSTTTLDLTSNAFDSRPLSMATTLLDEPAPRQSFQSSRSGGSEVPSQFTITPVKKRWWKQRESGPMYRISTTMSMADLEQDRELHSLLQIRSSENLTLNTQLMSMPLTLTEPSTPAPEFYKEAPAAMETIPTPKEAVDVPETKHILENTVEVSTKVAEPSGVPPTEVVVGENNTARVGEVAAEKVEPIAPIPKVKSKSSKPKLLPISTPLAQLLKLENPEEIWQYVQQAKTYATSRMNKGDKRSASIALKRSQALEARWQEVLLEMESSDEGSEALLEDDDDEEESEEEEVPVVVAPAKKETKKEAPVVVTPQTQATVSIMTANAPISFNSKPYTHNNDEDEEDEEEESYASQRRRSSVSRSSTTPDKYSKYKNNKSAAPTITSGPMPLTIVAEEVTTEDGELAVKDAESLGDGCLGPDATLEQLLESSNPDHLTFYIQRMKTDTVAKARSGSRFAALESMKNVKVLQQHLDSILEGKKEE